MIAHLRGMVTQLNTGEIVIDVQGVGYRVMVSDTLGMHTRIGDTVTVYTHMHVREDIMDLYGFAHAEDLILFRQLIDVSGIGPKTALGIFSRGNRSEIRDAIAAGDVSFFTHVPRLGTKNAQKIIIELKGKIDLTEGSDPIVRDVTEALRQFGFGDQEIRHVMSQIDPGTTRLEDRIAQALRLLGKGGRNG
jgi:Holliday junction DNA helicase RuvA